jgi:Ran GTPase-activating protein (RanGAP) involved in mRNA processing and transport
MGVICCTGLNKLKANKKTAKTKEQIEKEFEDLKDFYKANESFMHQKIQAIYKQVIVSQKYEIDTINLNFVNFKNTKAEFLVRVIPYSTNLKVLKLWKASLGSEEIKMISVELFHLSNLEILSLEDNFMGPDGTMHLSLVLPKLKKLRELWLHINDIGIIGATYLSATIGKLTRLEKLGLNENNMENRGTLKLMSVVKRLEHIKFIGLGYNLLTEDACLNIAVMLEMLPLEKLIIAGNSITQETHSRFISLLPKTLITF